MKSFLSKNETNNMETVRNAIKEGAFVHGETRIPNTEISNHKIAISTSYFSNDYNNPNIYVLECSPKEDGTGMLTSYIREDLS